MGHMKINNNIPVSPDKWIYEQDRNPIISVNDMTLEKIKKKKKLLVT
jgi:hypothetical protein